MVNSTGCEVLYAKIDRWWTQWDETEDVEFKALVYPYEGYNS